MREIAILSGKGGTGKTSLTAAFSVLCQRPVLVDCDVDAANLYLLLSPSEEESGSFIGGAKASLQPDNCNQCGLCVEACRFNAARMVDGSVSIDERWCEGCGVCSWLCPEHAIKLQPQICGKWFLSRTKAGPMFHARLRPGQENSGKLVSLLRRKAEALAHKAGAGSILLDGPPGTGCPVIASLSGVSYVVLVTEPTRSGFEDLKRVAAVVDHFRLPAGVVVNKADINAEVAASIERYAGETRRDMLGRIAYDSAFTQAQLVGSTVLATADRGLRGAIENAWKKVELASGQKNSSFSIIRKTQ